jgi:hypothetical protein
MVVFTTGVTSAISAFKALRIRSFSRPTAPGTPP